MKTARVGLCLAILLSWTLTGPAFAQQFLPPGQAGFDPGSASVGDVAGAEDGVDDMQTRSVFGSGLFDNRNYMLRTDAGDGLGYLRGFQTFAAWQPIIVTPDEFMFWMSPRGYVTFDSGLWAGNLGAGFRYLNPNNDRIFGAGFWWDHDNTSAKQYDQLGGSVEWLGNFLDFRANAYIPTNQNTQFVGQFFNANNVFIGHNIGIGRTTIFTSALRGGDFEAGGALPGLGDLGLRAYAGGYYYQGPLSGGGIYGVRGRLEALFTQNLWGTVAVTHDRVFGTNVTAAATIYLGTGQSPQFLKRIPMTTRLYQQMERQYRVAVQRDIENDFVLALRAGGTGGSGGPVGTPIFVDHVDNTAAAGGDGSVEHPFNQLPTTTPGNVDIIFVRRGDGTSNNMNQGIVLNDWQRLLGDGVQHMFTSTTGTFVLPGFTPGAFPTITNINPGGSAVTLASHNEVSGFNITSAALHGITGTNIVDFNINNVNVTGSGNSLGPTPVGAGMQLTNATGTGLIFDSKFNNNNAEGIRIDNGAGGILTLAVTNVQANSNLTGLELNATGSEIDPTVTKLTANSNVHDGIAISLAAASNMTGVFDQITANQNNNNPFNSTAALAGFGDGFKYQSDASTGTIQITRSTFDGNGLNGLEFVTSNGSTLTTSLINNNTTINGNLKDGVLFTSTDSAVTATLLNNVINNNGGFGVAVVSKGTGISPASFNLTVGGYLTQDTNGNGVLDPGEQNVSIPSLIIPGQTGSTIFNNGVINREGNTIIGNHGAGIAYTLLDLGTGTANIIGNTIQSTGVATPASTTYIGQAIDIRTTGTTVASNSTSSFTGGVIDDNVIGSLTDATLGNIGGGIRVLADQNTNFQNLQIGTLAKGNIIANNGNDGVNITRANTARMGTATPITVVNNNIRNNSGTGVTINALNSFDGVVNGFVIGNNQIVSNTSDGVLLHVEADANMNVDMNDNLISQNTLNGIHTTELVAAAGDQRGIGGTWVRNQITSNGGNGIHLDADNSSATRLLLIGSTTTAADGNLIQNNGLHGILINSPGTAVVGFNTIDSNATGGVYINARTFADFTISDNIITNNGTVSATVDGGDGIQVVDRGVGDATSTYNVTVLRNTIRNNAGRGINVLNQVNGILNINIDSNNITNNRLEGVYVVNTASATQSADVLSSAPLAADGSVLPDPHMIFRLNNNDIEGNGVDTGTFPAGASGLVMMIGTSDGGFGFTFDGGFASEGRGGIVATVTNNTFHGNLGDDLYFHSYVSTVNPIVTAGTWSNTQFSVTAYQSDPLSRLDLSFHNNTFDSTGLDVGQTPGALYNNAETVFKSRETGQTDPGPFSAGTRDRNATRLAARFGLPPATPGGLSNSFLYPGLGMSTFRLLDSSNGGATTLGDVIGAGFITDDVPYTGPGSANGVFLPGSQALPWGWTFLNGAAPPARPQ